jgi:hypothetical protein
MPGYPFQGILIAGFGPSFQNSVNTKYLFYKYQRVSSQNIDYQARKVIVGPVRSLTTPQEK